MLNKSTGLIHEIGLEVGAIIYFSWDGSEFFINFQRSEANVSLRSCEVG